MKTDASVSVELYKMPTNVSWLVTITMKYHRIPKVTPAENYGYPKVTLNFYLPIDPLHKWRLNLNNNTHTSLASHSCENSFVLKHECEAKDVPSIVIQI